MAGNQYFQFSAEGFKELGDAFEQLPKSVAKSVLVGALKEAAVPVVSLAKDLAPKHRGDLARSIQASTKLSRSQKRAQNKGAAAFVYVGPAQPQGAHGILSEFGTGPRFHDDGRYVGVMPAHPFMRPAWDATRAQVLSILKTALWKKLLGAAKSLAKRAAKGTLSKSVRRQLGGW